ncbi:hypothetical protein [Desertimonas flava]|jgi:hypothetical protein|uniref:hypothetical protein n=1 Tax=Desertimonas flava TaxID=2064846 RepID=UPI000E34104E|nr:hypothetical protein [Desertimonas flava]
MIWIIIGVAVVVVALGLLAMRRRRATDGVSTFQRQIDALSPEARRTVVDRVQRLDHESPPDEPGRVDGA